MDYLVIVISEKDTSGAQLEGTFTLQFDLDTPRDHEVAAIIRNCRATGNFPIDRTNYTAYLYPKPPRLYARQLLTDALCAFLPGFKRWKNAQTIRIIKFVAHDDGTVLAVPA